VVKRKSKKEYSDELNQLLGTEIDFTKLAKEDLIQLVEAIKQKIKVNRRIVEKIVDRGVEFLSRKERPILDKLMKVRGESS